jgi:DNA-directed RNA polymerase subunit RPC12/RpoP
MKNFIKCSLCGNELEKTIERSMKKCGDCALAE